MFLTSNDDLTFVQSPDDQASWPAGVARTNTFVLDVGVGVSGEVSLILHVLSDGGGHWEFEDSFLVVAAPSAGLVGRSF